MFYEYRVQSQHYTRGVRKLNLARQLSGLLDMGLNSFVPKKKYSVEDLIRSPREHSYYLGLCHDITKTTIFTISYLDGFDYRHTAHKHL